MTGAVALNKSPEVWLALQGADADVVETVTALTRSAIDIAAAVKLAPLDDQLGSAGQTNVQGEQQKQLDITSNEIMVGALSKCQSVAAMVSEEVSEVIHNNSAALDANLAVCFDPLDGSSNIETNGTIGSIFSIVKLGNRTGSISSEDILQAASNQVAAGYFLYGPSTLLVITTGKSVAMFALDGSSAFQLVKQDITIAKSAAEFSINMAYRRYWDTATTRYIDECIAGDQGPRGKNYNMRWMGAMVADIHKIFTRGGIFIYPATSKSGGENGKLRFLYEVNPMAMLVETAGGAAISENQRSMNIQPDSLHQRVPFAAGSAEEVDQYSQYFDATHQQSGTGDPS